MRNSYTFLIESERSEHRLLVNGQRIATFATLDAAKAEVVALDAQIQAAKIAVNLARVTLGYTKVIAPMAGTVVAIVATFPHPASVAAPAWM